MGMPGVRCMNVLSTIDILQVKSNRKMKCQNRAAKSTNIEVQFIPIKSTSLSFKLLTGNQPLLIDSSYKVQLHILHWTSANCNCPLSRIGTISVLYPGLGPFA